MYLDYFGLHKKPFLISPDPDFLYLSRVHQEALVHLYYGLQREGGFLLLTGEVGTGKTTLCRLLIDDLPENFRLAYILNAQLDSLGLLKAICKELHIKMKEKDIDLNSCMELLYGTLLKGHAENCQTLVVIEEAQNLSPEVLETLRLLTNLETSTTKLLHILLIGQPELLDTLARPQLRQLNQRVVSRCHLSGLTSQEVALYLKHRLKIAGRDENLFTKSAICAIYRYTSGIPRQINLLAERTLIGAYAEERQKVNFVIAKKAVSEVFGSIPEKKFSGLVINKVESTAFICISIVAMLLASNILVSEVPFGQLAGIIQNRLVKQGNDLAGNQSEEIELTETLPINQFEVSENEQSQLHKTAPAGVFSQWISQQGISASVNSLNEACQIAEEKKCRCEFLDNITVDSLHHFEKTALITLLNKREGKDFYVLNNWAETGLTLASGSGVKSVPLNEFIKLWDQTAVVIWRPPAGFKKPLFPGESNSVLVEYLENRLRDMGLLKEQLITGGIYSDYLVQKVKDFQLQEKLQVDGIVGTKTLLRLAMERPPEPTPYNLED